MPNKIIPFIRRCTGKKIPFLCLKALDRIYPGMWRKFLPPTSSYGCVWMLQTGDEAISALLDAIPSETTKAERRFLYNFFRSIWDGQRDVLEVGPFLGGTTRAIALGMLHHPNRNPDALLHTYDRFDSYYEGSELASFVNPLLEKGILKKNDRDQILHTASFEDIFHRVHEGQQYQSLIKCTNGPLPDAPDEEARIKVIFAPPTNRSLGVLFIDGCKSWYGTRYFMEKVAPCCQPGSWFIAQDYSQHTCFWLPAFFEEFSDVFELHLYVDSTYCFQLKKSLTAEEVLKRFPPAPEEWGKQKIGRLFERLIKQACQRDDRRSRLVYTIQWAAALTYIGLHDDARGIFDQLSAASWTYGSEEFIHKTRHNPTYKARLDGIEQLYLD